MILAPPPGFSTRQTSAMAPGRIRTVMQHAPGVHQIEKRVGIPQMLGIAHIQGGGQAERGQSTAGVLHRTFSPRASPRLRRIVDDPPPAQRRSQHSQSLVHPRSRQRREYRAPVRSAPRAKSGSPPGLVTAPRHREPDSRNHAPAACLDSSRLQSLASALVMVRPVGDAGRLEAKASALDRQAKAEALDSK